MMEEETEEYTFYYKDGTKEVRRGTRTEILRIFNNKSNVTFVVKGVSDRYVFKAGLWTVTHVSEEE